MGQRRLAFAMALAGLALALPGPCSAGARSGAGLECAVHEADRLHTSFGGEAAERAAPLPPVSTVASVAVVAEIRGTRVIVVDDEDRVLAIWSNTSAPDCDLVVREMSVNGPERVAAGAPLWRYRELVEDVDWTRRGLVYSWTP